MKNSIEMSKYEKDPQEEQLKEIILFVKDNKLTSDEFFMAYKIAMGFKPEEVSRESQIREEIFTLAKNLDNMMHEGLAANLITGLIDTKSEYESMYDNYNSLVDAMQIGEKEKRLLHSIVDKKRVGAVIIQDIRTLKTLVEITIPKDYKSEEYSTNDFAAILIQDLKKFAEKEVGISFSEL